MAFPNPIASWTDREPVFGGSNAEMYEEDDEFVLTFEMPGFECEQAVPPTFCAPKEIGPDGVDATYRNGVLEETMPVAEAEQTGRIIEVGEA